MLGGRCVGGVSLSSGTKLSTSVGLRDQDLTATARNTCRKRWFGIPGNRSPRLHPAAASRGKVVQHLWRVKGSPGRRQEKDRAVCDSLKTY